MLLSFEDAEPLASRLAEKLGCPRATVEIHRFPDGESRVRLPETVASRIILCRSLHNPNSKLVELLLAARGARELGAQHITLVAPYLCYMRQDIAFQPGEIVSQRIIGEFLAREFDALVSVDPHLHRTPELSDAVPVSNALAVAAAPAMGKFLASRHPNALLLGPDRESEQWVSSVAQDARLDYGVADKKRSGDRDVAVTLPLRDFRNRHVILIDDVASSGHTLAQAALALDAAGASRIDALVTHGLFAGDSQNVLREAGIKELWSSDSITHPSNAFSVAPAIANALNVGGGTAAA